MPCHDGCWLVNEPTVRKVLPRRGSKEDRHLIPPSGLPAAVLIPTALRLEDTMFMIGIDPHKGSHTATALTGDEVVVGHVRVAADRHQRARLLEWAAAFQPRTWAIEGATGMGAMLAQQLVGAGERVVDVPPKLSARMRLLADRYRQLTAQRTRTVCRLHALLCLVIEGGTGRHLDVARATKLVAR